MLGYRKKSFQTAHALLRDIGADPGNLAALSSLQVLLIDEIVRAEEKIRTLKRALTRIETKDSAEAPGKNAAYLSNRIDRLRQLAFVWRCFGDGIAFVYMDRFALKQTYYNTHNHNAKQDSGFLGGKGGLEHELAVLEEGLAAGIPCLLTDLTNTIRHGDVCFMVGPDPRLVEVKTGR